MEATADTLINQVAGLFLSKLDKQNLDPNFLQKFMDGVLNKLNLSSSKAIQQKAVTSSKPPSKGSLVDELKTVYRDLINDSSYKSDYKKFLVDVLPKELFDQQINNIAQPTPEIETKPTLAAASPAMDEGRAQLIDKPVETQKVVFDGFSNRGWAFFSERLPKILKGILPVSKSDKSQSGGFDLLGGGIALLLGGLAALVAGLNTDGPFKGILKILSKAGLQGGIKILEIAAKGFIGSLKQVIMAPINLLDDAAKLIGKIFGKEAYKAVLKPLRGMTGIFTKMLGGLTKFITPLLKKLPLIGTVISWGFAYSRFKSGDIVGGIIDVLSGIASIFPGVGTAIAIGLDVLNAFLDVKGGGANEQTTQKKTGLLKEWALSLGKILYDGVKYIPIIGPLIQAVEDMQSGKWLDATYNLVRAIPGLGIVIDVVNWFTEGQTEQGIKEGLSNTGNMIGEWLNWVKENIWEKITGFVTGVFEGVKDWWNNLSWDPSSWIGTASEIYPLPKPTEQDKTAKQVKETSNSDQIKTAQDKTAKQVKETSNSDQIKTAKEINETITPMAKGGIVTEPTKALIGEAGPEAVVPLEKYFDPQNLSLNNTTLEQIASNTKDTNSSLKALSEAIFKLVTIVDKKTSQGGTTVINAGGKVTQQTTSASVIANTNIDPIRRVRMQFA
jgi:hypothetical protein